MYKIILVNSRLNYVRNEFILMLIYRIDNRSLYYIIIQLLFFHMIGLLFTNIESADDLKSLITDLSTEFSFICANISKHSVDRDSIIENDVNFMNDIVDIKAFKPSDIILFSATMETTSLSREMVGCVRNLDSSFDRNHVFSIDSLFNYNNKERQLFDREIQWGILIKLVKSHRLFTSHQLIESHRLFTPHQLVHISTSFYILSSLIYINE